jgi:hypothetical protein
MFVPRFMHDTRQAGECDLLIEHELLVLHVMHES